MWQHMASWPHELATCRLWPWQGWVGSAPLQKSPSALIPCHILQQPNIVLVPSTSPIRDLVTRGKGHQKVVALPVSPCFWVSLAVQAIGTPTAPGFLWKRTAGGFAVLLSVTSMALPTLSCW